MFDAIEQKTGASRADLAAAGLLAYWQEKQDSFVASLRKAVFGAVIMDFDGTVYAGGQPYGVVLPEAMQSALVTLLESGMLLSFASGRGDSLRIALRAALPRQLWERVYVAYQDGAETGRLDDDSLPTAYMPELEDQALASARQKLEQIFSHWPKAPVLRPENQLLGFRCQDNASEVFAACCDIALPLGLKCFKSSRMVDIVTNRVSKRNLELVPELRRHDILALGDAGAWPGNDCELLSGKYGISVGSVGPCPDTCWRLTDEAGPEGTVRILRSLAKKENGFQLDWK